MTTSPDVAPLPESPSSPAPPARASRRVGATIAANYSVPLGLLALIVLFSILAPSAFLTLGNFQVMLGSQSVLLMLSLAAMTALAANEFDVSIGPLLSFASVEIWALTHEAHVPLGLAVVIVLLTAMAIGAINGFLAVRLGINSFIATLATGTVLTGIALKLTGETIVAGVPEALSKLTASNLLGIQVVFYYAIALAIVLWYVLEHTPLGRWTLFVGSGPEVARLAGLPVNAIRLGSLIASAAIAGAAGVLQAGLLGSADPNTGMSLLLPAFAAVFLGATTIKRGRVNVWGTTLAVYLVIVGIVGLQITTGASGWIVSVFNGGVLLVALIVSAITSARAAGSRREAVHPQ